MLIPKNLLFSSLKNKSSQSVFFAGNLTFSIHNLNSPIKEKLWTLARIQRKKEQEIDQQRSLH